MISTTWRRRAAAVTVSLAAILGVPGSGARAADPAEAAQPALQNLIGLFISPSGEPFRATNADGYPIGRWFGQADTDRSDALSVGEMQDDAARFFALVDTSADGNIDGLEVARYEREIAPEITRIHFDPAAMMAKRKAAAMRGGGMRGGGMGGGMGGKPGGMGGMGRGGMGGGGMGGGGMGGGGGAPPGAASRIAAAQEKAQQQFKKLEKLPQGAALFSLINEPQPLRAADADLSMRVSREEWKAATDRRFRLLDADKNGLLQLKELGKTPIQKLAERRGS